MSSPILVIARLTWREMVRRKVLAAVVILTLLLVTFTGWGFQRLLALPCNGQPCPPTTVKLIAATLMILVMYVFSFVIALGAAFMAAPAISGDIDSGLALAMLPRPIRRSEVLLGKWLALALLIVGYALLACGLEFIVVNVFIDYVPPNPLLVIAYIMAQGIVLLTLALLGSTRLAPMTGGIVAVVLFGLAWMAGVAEGLGRALDYAPLANVGVVTRLILPTDGLWRGAIYYLEPAVMFAATRAGGPSVAAANPFFSSAPPTTPYVLWVAIWVLAMLGLAIYNFQRREL